MKSLNMFEVLTGLKGQYIISLYSKESIDMLSGVFEKYRPQLDCTPEEHLIKIAKKIEDEAYDNGDLEGSSVKIKKLLEGLGYSAS